MKVLNEYKKKNKSYYRYIETINDVDIVNKVIDVQVAQVNIDDDVKYIVYHTDKTFDPDVYNFLNETNKFDSKNTRKQYAYSLRVLSVWEEIINKRFTEFTVNDLQAFVYFLYGKSGTGNELTLNLITSRKRASASTIFAHSKKLYKKVKEIYVEGATPFDAVEKKNKLGYSSNIRKKSINDAYFSEGIKEVPKYISEEEFIRIVKIIRNTPLPPRNKTNKNRIKNIKRQIKRDEIIVRLMYEGGLRLGEVLGLTVEDVLTNKNKYGEVVGKVLIRNRFTDKEFQSAKTCMKILDQKDYEISTYKQAPYGYQEAYFSYELYELIQDYINLAHKNASKRQKDNYKKAVADKVGRSKSSLEDNHYIFLNADGGVYSDDSWNQRLRKIFKEANIEVDRHVRKNNLSHRFRHGFVMRLIELDEKKGVPTDILLLAKRTRHRNPLSLMAYFNPTAQKIIAEKLDIEKYMNLDED